MPFEENDGGEIISKHYSPFIVCRFYCQANETALHARRCTVNNRKYFHSNNLTLLMVKERGKKKLPSKASKCACECVRPSNQLKMRKSGKWSCFLWHNHSWHCSIASCTNETTLFDFKALLWHESSMHTIRLCLPLSLSSLFVCWLMCAHHQHQNDTFVAISIRNNYNTFSTTFILALSSHPARILSFSRTFFLIPCAIHGRRSCSWTK